MFLIIIDFLNLDFLEDGYGINLLPLATFAMETYEEDPCDCFQIKGKNTDYEDEEKRLIMQMHKAIVVIQMKLEGQIIRRRPEYGMEDRAVLDKIDFAKGTVCIEGKEYPMKDRNFPTIDPENPCELSPAEAEVMNRICTSFRHCEKLQQHMGVLLKKGNLYKVYNGNLLGCGLCIAGA